MESPSHYEAPAVPVSILALIESVVQLSQIYALSSVQLSPNRVREDYSYDIMDVFPVFQVSPEIDGYIPATSPVMPPVSREFNDFSGHSGSGLSATGSDSLMGGPVMSRSLIEQATDLSRLSPPLIQLPDDLLRLPLPVSLRPQSSPGRQSPVEPLVDSSRMDC